MKRKYFYGLAVISAVVITTVLVGNLAFAKRGQETCGCAKGQCPVISSANETFSWKNFKINFVGENVEKPARPSGSCGLNQGRPCGCGCRKNFIDENNNGICDRMEIETPTENSLQGTNIF